MADCGWNQTPQEGRSPGPGLVTTTQGLLKVLDTSVTVNVSDSLIIGLLQMENSGNSSVPGLSREKVAVKLLEGKICANMFQIKHRMCF